MIKSDLFIIASSNPIASKVGFETLSDSFYSSKKLNYGAETALQLFGWIFNEANGSSGSSFLTNSSSI